MSTNPGGLESDSDIHTNQPLERAPPSLPESNESPQNKQLFPNPEATQSVSPHEGLPIFRHDSGSHHDIITPPARKSGVLSSLARFGHHVPPLIPGNKDPWSRASVSVDNHSGNNKHVERKSSIASFPGRVLLQRPRRSSVIVRNVEGFFRCIIRKLSFDFPDTEVTKRRKFILKLAKALLSFGAPSHRIESQLAAASEILDAQAGSSYACLPSGLYPIRPSTEFVHLPNIIIVTIRNGDTRSTRTYFVRATGRIALTSLHKVHLIYRDVLHDNMGAEAGTDALRQLLRSPPIYSLTMRCGLAFICASIICVLSFGGSILDMWVSGACACVLQYLGLNAANKSSMYANVYESVPSFLPDHTNSILV